MLVLLGVMNLTGAWSRLERSAHEHAHGASGSLLRPLAIGVVHGLAGSAAIALLVLATIHDAQLALAYLAVFSVGTIAGMMLITSALALPLSALNRRLRGGGRQLARIAGGISLVFGLFLAYHIGISQGFFSSHPQWTPR